MTASDDRELAFRRIYEANYARITAFARRRVDGADVDDVVAETFLVAWRRLGAVPGGERTLPWLYGVARRVVSERRRSGRRRDRLVTRLGGLRPDDDARASDVDQFDEHARVQAALALLRERDQEILRLAEWEEMTTAEISVVLECSPNASAIRLHRAHKRFAKALGAVDARIGAVRQGE